MAFQGLAGGDSPNLGSIAGTYGIATQWRGLSIIDSPRFRDLDRKQAYYDCTQHDYKRFDFDGRVLEAKGGMAYTQPLLSQQKASWYVPLRSRRPSSPYRLPKVIVNSFTKLLFGDDRFPTFRCLGDFATEDYAAALVEATNLPTKMIRARNLGGACGTSALSWAFVDGRPRVRVHNAKTLFVHSWEDRDELVPRHVTEAYLYAKDEWDKEKKKFLKVLYWYRRDWTKDVDIVFKPLKFENGVDPSPRWEPDLGKCAEHNDGLCHVSWIQNRPNDEEIDGHADYEGLYEPFDVLDLLLSVITRGAVLNLDPTLVLKMDPEIVNRVGVSKGSDNSLVVGQEGGADYLELGGSSIDAGVKLFNEQRKGILETACVVIPDPDKVAANGTSSVAIKMMYASMLGEASILRDQYAQGMKRILEPMMVVARKASKSTIIIYDEQGQPIDEATPEIDLPDRVEEEPEKGEDGEPTGETTVTKTPRDPGEGEDLAVDWGEWFTLTPQDQQLIITTVTTAVGVGQSVMAAQSGSEIVAKAFGRDGNEEWSRVQKTQADQDAKQKEMFQNSLAAGGGKPPFGGKPGGKPGKPGANPFAPKGPPVPPPPPPSSSESGDGS